MTRSSRYLTALLVAACAQSTRGAAFNIDWTKQVGTAGYDEILAIATDPLGNVATVGRTSGNWGAPASPNQDAIVSKYDNDGGLQWLRQLSSDGGHLWAYGVATDGAGNVYFGGHTQGNNFGQHVGDWDAYVGKYDAVGNLQWTRQLGTVNEEISHSVAADLTGNVYIVGYTTGNLAGPNLNGRDGFLAKYDSAGVFQWSRQSGAALGSEATDVAVDYQGNLLVTGFTGGGVDVFVSKYNPQGRTLWTKQFGSAQGDESYGIASDAQGAVYIAGFTGGNLAGPIGGRDGFLAKYDSAGNPVWTRQFGSTGFDSITDVAVDELGVYVSGATRGKFTQPGAGQDDLLVAGFTPAGHLKWKLQRGSNATDFLGGIAVDNAGGIFLAGYTQGNLVSPVAGLGDAVLMKVAVPEPQSLAIASSALFALLSLRRAVRLSVRP